MNNKVKGKPYTIDRRWFASVQSKRSDGEFVSVEQLTEEEAKMMLIEAMDLIDEIEDGNINIVDKINEWRNR